MDPFLEQISSQLRQKSLLYIRMKVTAKMPQTKIVDQMEDETYKIRVAAIPVRGASNRALCTYLKKSLKASDVAIVSGGRDKVKLIRISR